jgi:hypothetical protein
MSKERELLEHCRLYLSVLGVIIKHSAVSELINNIDELLAQPEQEKQEPVAWMCNLLGDVVTDRPADSNGYTPLYLAPSKREPSMTGREMYQRGYAKAERDLKREPLSDAELIGRYETIRISSFYVGFRDAEKMHGIGE